MHMLIYGARQRSYRELPLRLFEFGTVYRYEKSGVVHGLLRARGFTQDDSHIFCTPEQLGDELTSLLAFVLKLLRDYGFDEFEAELATRPDKFVGEPADWDEAEETLRQAVEAAGIPYVVAEGEGRVLRPEDRRARARRHRPPLAALDPAGRLPVRRPVRPRVRRRRQRTAPAPHHPPGAVRVVRPVLRRAARAHGRRAAHLAGPGAGRRAARARPTTRTTPAGSATACGPRACASRWSSADEPLGARIRKAKLEKVPHVVVVGDDDVAHDTVGDNPRGRRRSSATCPSPTSSSGCAPRSPPTPDGRGETPGRGRGRCGARRRAMDRMWAGWRSTYVAAVGNGALAGEGSIFRRILDSGLPDDETHIVWRGETRVRHPQRLPVHERPPAADALPRGARPRAPRRRPRAPSCGRRCGPPWWRSRPPTGPTGSTSG